MQIARKKPIPTSFSIEEKDTLNTEITWIEDFNQSEEQLRHLTITEIGLRSTTVQRFFWFLNYFFPD
jgi:hypothetical protein